MRALWPWLRLLAGLGILVALGWRLGTGAFLDGLRSITLTSVLAALAIGLLTTLASAGRWQLVARGLGLRLGLGKAVADYYRGLLLNAVLPAGVLGDVHRAVSHGRESGDLGRGVRAVVFERFAGQVVLIGVGLAVLLTGTMPAVDLVPSPGVLGLVLAAAAVALVLVLRRVPAVRRELAATLTDARQLLASGSLLKVALLSAVALGGHLLLFVVAARAAGATASLGVLLPVFVLALLVMALPVNVGGFGPREAFLAVAFGAAGLGAAQGLTTGVVYGVLALVAALPGALVLWSPAKNREGVRERLDQPRQQLGALVS